MLQFGIAKELGITLSELRATMTAEEIIGWSAYFGILNEDQEKELAKKNELAEVARKWDLIAGEAASATA